MAGILYELQVKLGLDTKDYDEGIKDAKDKGSTFGDVLKGSLASAAIQKGFSVITSGVKTAAGAFKNVTTGAVNAYSSYEQLTGGVQTLFGTGGKSLEEYAKGVGKSAGAAKKEYESLQQAESTVLKNAQNAYKTAGMSANEYMETATSFSASLISSLGGDTKKAAKYADDAIKDMSDNANKMGTDISSIQAAYQGFAKQNYSMLDNLKLGYGGTQEEMYRLLTDAAKIDKAFASNAKFSLDSKGHLVANFSDITRAIGIVQEKMGITGTTAKEAMTTIEGTSKATKAAWQNVLTAIAGGGDLNEALKQMQEAIFGGKKGEGLLNQIIPRVKIVFQGIAEFVGKAAPILQEKLPKLLNDLKPALESLVKSIGVILKTLIPLLVPVFLEVGKAFVSGIIGGLGDLGPVGAAIEAAIGAIVAAKFIKGAGDLTRSLTDIGKGLVGVSGKIKEFSTGSLSTLKNFVTSGLSTLSSGMSQLSGVLSSGITSLSSFVTNGIQVLSSGISQFATFIVSNPMIIVVGLIVAAIVAAVVLIVKNWDTIKKKTSEMWKNVKTTFSVLSKGVTQMAKDAAEGVKKWWGDMTTSVGNKISDLKTNAVNKFKEIKQNVGDAVNTLSTNVKDKFDTLKTNLGTVFGDIRDSATEKWNAIKESASTVWEGIKIAMSNPIDTAKRGISTAINAVKNVFSGLETFAKGIGTAMKKIGEAIVAPIKAASQVIQSILSGIKSFYNSIKNVATSIGKAVSGAVKTASTKLTGTARHADAMGEGVILNRLTTIGYGNGTIHQAGEAGEEAVIGTKSLSNLIKNSVRNGMRGTGSGVTINVYGAQGQNINDLADAVAERFQNIVDQKAAVWA